MSAANRGARYGLETPSSYGRIFPQRAVPTAKFLRAIRGCRRRFPARRTQGGAWGWLLCHPKARRRPCGTPEANRREGTCGGAVTEVSCKDRKSVVKGKCVSVRVDLGGGRIHRNNKQTDTEHTTRSTQL